jgi:hypothetical protein
MVVENLAHFILDKLTDELVAIAAELFENREEPREPLSVDVILCHQSPKDVGD